MPAKNAERTIGLAVRSALFAMPANSEIIVLLDGCTDNTSRVLGRIKDKRVRVITSDIGLGIVLARNRLLSEAKSDIVAILDADDICLPWRFKYELKALSRGFDFVASTALIFGASLKPLPLLPQIPLGLEGSYFDLMLSSRNPIVHSTVIYKRQTVLRIGGYPDLIPGEDYSLWLKMAASGAKMSRLAFPTILYRYHPKQISGNLSFLQLSSSDRVLSDLKLSLARKMGFSESEADRREALYRWKFLARVEIKGLSGVNRRKPTSQK